MAKNGVEVKCLAPPSVMRWHQQQCEKCQEKREFGKFRPMYDHRGATNSDGSLRLTSLALHSLQWQLGLERFGKGRKPESAYWSCEEPSI